MEEKDEKTLEYENICFRCDLISNLIIIIHLGVENPHPLHPLNKAGGKWGTDLMPI